MPGTNPVGTFVITDQPSMLPTAWWAQSDANSAVAQRIIGAFAPHPAASPAMSVVVDAGYLVATGAGGAQTVTEVAQATVTIATAPGSPNNRIDLVYIDVGTGAAAVVAGTPATSPAAPALPVGKAQVALVSVPNGTSAITSTLITDVRALGAAQSAGIPWAVATGTGDAMAATYTPANASLVDGELIAVRAVGANTVAFPTLAKDGGGAFGIGKGGGSGLAPGDISGAAMEMLLRFNVGAGNAWELLNPANGLTPPNSYTAPAYIISSATLTSADDGKLIICTGSGTYTVNLRAPGTIGRAVSFYCAPSVTAHVTVATPSGLIVQPTVAGGSGGVSSVTLASGSGGFAKFVDDVTTWIQLPTF